MVKVEKLTVDNYVGAGKKGQLYLNRRYDDNYQIEGDMINKNQVERGDELVDLRVAAAVSDGRRCDPPATIAIMRG